MKSFFLKMDSKLKSEIWEDCPHFKKCTTKDFCVENIQKKFGVQIQNLPEEYENMIKKCHAAKFSDFESGE